MTWSIIANGRSYTPAEYEHLRTRPDLPPCERCGSGTKCSCQVNAVIYEPDYDPSKDYGVMACSCMGFTGCPDCGRGLT